MGSQNNKKFSKDFYTSYRIVSTFQNIHSEAFLPSFGDLFVIIITVLLFTFNIYPEFCSSRNPNAEMTETDQMGRVTFVMVPCLHSDVVRQLAKTWGERIF